MHKILGGLVSVTIALVMTMPDAYAAATKKSPVPTKKSAVVTKQVKKPAKDTAQSQNKNRPTSDKQDKKNKKNAVENNKKNSTKSTDKKNNRTRANANQKNVDNNPKEVRNTKKTDRLSAKNKKSNNRKNQRDDDVIASFSNSRKNNDRINVRLRKNTAKNNTNDGWVTYRAPSGHILRPENQLAHNKASIERVSYRPSSVYSNKPEPKQIITRTPPPVIRTPAPRLSAAERAGLAGTYDPLALKSNAAFVIDESNMKVLFEKNANIALPMASITKLMTAMVVVESHQDMNEILEISDEDVDRLKYSSSRLRVGVQMTRADMLHIALMSSENRAASSLGRHYPGGKEAFVNAMNIKAQLLGMSRTHYVDTNGLSSQNVSTARDLAKLIMAASRHPIIRQYSTDTYYAIHDGDRTIHYGTTNGLVRIPDWHIAVQKTGYISEAGQCLVLKSMINGRPVVMVFLDSKGKGARIADARRMRNWLVQSPGVYHQEQTYSRPSPSHSYPQQVEDDLYL